MPAAIGLEIRKKLKPRKKTAHKNSFGRVFILAGSKDYSGAAYLCAAACLRAGAGLVTLAVPQSIHSIVSRRQPELIVKPCAETSRGTFSMKSLPDILKALKGQDILVMGPGLSRHPQTQKIIHALIRKTKLNLVLDADALNALAGHQELLKHCASRSILTPHAGEFVRLFGGKLTDSSALRKQRALEAAKKSGCVVILKGHRSVLAHPSGKVYVNATGNPGMATAGTGDVLAGMIAALLSQGLSLWESARFGVYLHGLSGDFAARQKGEISLIAGDLIEFLPKAFQKTLSR